MSEEMTITEYAVWIGVSTDTVRRRIKKGILPAVKRLDGNIPTWYVQLDSSETNVSPTRPSTQEIAAWLIASPWLEVVSRSIDKNGDLNWTVKSRIPK